MKDVDLRKPKLAVFSCLILISNFLSGCSQNNFTGTFLADSRPHQILLLNLIQTKDTVTGSLIVAKPNGNGGMHSDTLPIRGTTDGNVITLTVDRFFEDLVINGKKEGKDVVLMPPVDSGKISRLTAKPTTENDYNTLLNQWQAEFAEISKEKEELAKLDKALFNDTNAIKNADIKGEMLNIKSALANEQSALHELENNLDKLVHDALIRPMTCYQANQVVKYDFEQVIGYNYKQNFQYANNQFQTALQRVEEELSNVESMSIKIKKVEINLFRLYKQVNFLYLNSSVNQVRIFLR